MLGSSKSLHTTATRAQYLRLLLAMTAQPRELASDSVIHPTPTAAADLSSVSVWACYSVTVSQGRLPVAALSLSLGLPQLGLLRKSSRIAAQRMACWQSMAGHGMAGQGRTGWEQGGSDASSLTDDGMAKGQTGPRPRPAGCQSWPLAGPAGCFNVCQRPEQCDVLFSAPILMAGWNRISIRPCSQAAQRAGKQQRSSAVCLHGTLRIRMSAILAGRLGAEVERPAPAPSSNHNRHGRPCKSGW